MARGRGLRSSPNGKPAVTENERRSRRGAGDGPVLHGQRASLRALRLSDAAALDEALRNPEVTRYLPARARTENGGQFVARARKEQRQGGGACFAIQRGQGPEVVGQIRFIDWSRRERKAEVGVWLSRPLWGQGLGTEALRLACRYGFRVMRLRRISAAAVAENTRSDRMLRRVGFRREGCLRSGARVGLRWVDVWIYGMLPGELERA